jgi:hypothetical protein
MPAITEHAGLRAAARTIYIAATGTTPGDPNAIAAAHTTLTQHRHRATGPARQAIDHYLDDTTWHQGPVALHAAIHQLADALDTLPPPTAIVAEQLQLFGPSTGRS